MLDSWQVFILNKYILLNCIINGVSDVHSLTSPTRLLDTALVEGELAWEFRLFFSG